jgi:tetratricopeptide (TPR) repeat protein
VVEVENDASTKNQVSNYIDLGNEKYFCGFYESALKCYALALKQKYKEVDAWVGQIRVFIDNDQLSEALFWADRGLMQFPGSEKLEFAKAFALASQGKTEQAKNLINKPIKKNEAPLIWLYRGEIMIRLKSGFFQKLLKPYKKIGKIGAFFCFLRALELNPRDAFINQRIGIAYLQANNIPRAYDHLKASLIAVPQNALTLYCLAECYRKNNDHKHALYYTKKAITLNPELDAAIELLQWLHSPQARFIQRIRKII